MINVAVWGGALAYYYIDARKWFKGPKGHAGFGRVGRGAGRSIERRGIRIEGLDGKHESTGGAEMSVKSGENLGVEKIA